MKKRLVGDVSYLDNFLVYYKFACYRCTLILFAGSCNPL